MLEQGQLQGHLLPKSSMRSTTKALYSGQIILDLSGLLQETRTLPHPHSHPTPPQCCALSTLKNRPRVRGVHVLQLVFKRLYLAVLYLLCCTISWDHSGYPLSPSVSSTASLDKTPWSNMLCLVLHMSKREIPNLGNLFLSP